MSLSVALQSVLFYVVACTPCAQVRHRKKTRQQAKKEREEKAHLEAMMPGLYRHPSPFATNPYWEEEIMMGPSLPKKGRAGDWANKSTSQRKLNSAGQDSGMTTRSSLAMSHGGPNASTATDAMPSSGLIHGLGSAPTVVPEEDAGSAALSKTASVSTGDDWNRKRYQREDEELWGHDLSRTGHKLMDAIKHAGTSAGRFVEAKLGMEKQVTDEDRYQFYSSPKNPPVNDYHPPVVSSKPAHIDGHHWMLQPPPPAKVMEGRVPVSRTASMASMTSRRTMASGDGALARLVGERAVEAKLRMGETPAESRARSNSSLSRPHARRPATAGPRGQTPVSSRSRSPSTESDDEDEWMSRSGKSSGNSMLATHAAQRPRLSAIPSSDTTEQSELTEQSDKSHAEASFQRAGNANLAEPAATIKEEPRGTSMDSDLA